MVRRSGGSRPGVSRRPVVAVLCALTILGGCAAGGAAGSSIPSAGSTGSVAAASGGSPTGSIELYTSVTQDTVDAVTKGLKAVAPGLGVTVFRAPTGQLNARIAADQRSGGLKADVIWLTDPLSMQPLERQGLLANWTPPSWQGLPDRYRTQASFGTRLLNMVLIVHKGVTPAPASWRDLTNAAYRGAVAIPDPGFAGSAFGVLGYLGSAPGYGLDFYRQLKANGAVQVQSIADVITGVAQGRFKVGMTLDNSANAAIAKGSPLTMVWPSPGAIAVISPIAVVAASRNAAGARAFVDYVLTLAGQKAIASTGWEPIRAEAGGPQPGGAQVQPDWAAAAARQEELLQEYRSIFGG